MARGEACVGNQPRRKGCRAKLPPSHPGKARNNKAKNQGLNLLPTAQLGLGVRVRTDSLVQEF